MSFKTAAFSVLLASFLPTSASAGEPLIPNPLLQGKAVDVFIGEMDPFVVGDVCITYVKVEDEGDFAPGLYGVIEDIFDCNLAFQVNDGDLSNIVIAQSELAPVRQGMVLEELNDFESATYLILGMDHMPSPLGEPGILPNGLSFGGASMGQMGKLDLFSILSKDAHKDPLVQSDLVLLGKRSFGNGCDGVPDFHADIQLKSNKNVFAFLSFLKNGTKGWQGVPSKNQQKALRDWIFLNGAKDFVVYYGRTAGDACGGSGEVSYNLIWNVEKGEAIYLVMYPSAD